MKRLKSLEQVEDHRARISLDMVCEFMRDIPDELSTKDIPLLAFQQRVGTKILSPNENQEYEKYRKKYRQLKKKTGQKSVVNAHKTKSKITTHLSKDSIE